MITLYNLTNISRFFQLVDTCSKPVFIRTKCGNTEDIRNNPLLYSLLSDCSDGKSISRLSIQTESEQDLQAIMHFMMQEQSQGLLHGAVSTEPKRERAS